jgi:hypothetical protein
VITQTDPIPGLPYICAKQHAPEPLFDACNAGFGNLKTSFKSRLGLHGFVRLTISYYMSMPNLVRTADFTWPFVTTPFSTKFAPPIQSADMAEPLLNKTVSQVFYRQKDSGLK